MTASSRSPQTSVPRRLPRGICSSRSRSAPRSSSALGATENWELFDSGTIGARFQPFTNDGTALELFDENGVRHMAFEPDANGEGGFLTVESGGGTFFVDGSAFDSDTGPRMQMFGTTSFFEFDTNSMGDTAAVLPMNSVSSIEILDEAGGANGSRSVVDFTNSVSTLLSRTITAPGPGLALVLASVEVTVGYTGSSGFTLIAVSDRANDEGPGNTDWSFALPSGLPTGAYSQVLSGHAVFEIPAAGEYTYYLNGRRSGLFSPAATDLQLTVVYLPTSYGAVTATATSGSAIDDAAGAGAPMTAADIRAEQEAARAWDAARRAAEIAEIQALQADIRAMQGDLNEKQAQLDARLERLESAASSDH